MNGVRFNEARRLRLKAWRAFQTQCWSEHHFWERLADEAYVMLTPADAMRLTAVLRRQARKYHPGP